MKSIINKLLLLLTLLSVRYISLAQQVLPLYPDSVPNSIGKFEADQLPTLEVYLPIKGKSTGTAVLVIPGGAYAFLAYKEEGTIIAKSFAERGIAAFVLKYRLPSNSTMLDKSIGPLQDAQQAIKMIRLNAKEWNVDPKAVGVIGFSAGGHLASTLGTHYKTSYISNGKDDNLRPDFMILIYPVISMNEKLTHAGSRKNLLGENPSEERVLLFSNERQVTSETPPTYITHAADDNVVSINNSLEMYKALIARNVPSELYLVPRGDHGFIQRLPVNEWLDPIISWIKKEGFYDTEIVYKSLFAGYKSGVKDLESLKKLIKLTIKAKDSLALRLLSRDFIKGLKKPYNKRDLIVLQTITKSTADPGFNFFLKHHNQMDDVLGFNNVDGMVLNLINDEINSLVTTSSLKPEWDKIRMQMKIRYGNLGEEAAYKANVMYEFGKEDYNGTVLPFANYAEFITKLYGNRALNQRFGGVNVNNIAFFAFQNFSDVKTLNLALDWEKQVLVEYPDYYPGIDTYANLLYRLGYKEEAIKWERKALVLSPENEKALYKETLEKMEKGLNTWEDK